MQIEVNLSKKEFGNCANEANKILKYLEFFSFYFIGSTLVVLKPRATSLNCSEVSNSSGQGGEFRAMSINLKASHI